MDQNETVKTESGLKDQAYPFAPNSYHIAVDKGQDYLLTLLSIKSNLKAVGGCNVALFSVVGYLPGSRGHRSLKLQRQHC